MCQVYKVTDGWVLNGKNGGLTRLDAKEAELLESFRQLSDTERDMLLKLVKNAAPNKN